MTRIIIKDVYTGGGCEHLCIQFIDYGVEFNIMNADEYSTNHLPEDGGPFCFNLCKIQDGIDGDYLEVSDTFQNFNSETIKDFCLGFLAARNIKPVEEVESEPYDIDELFSSINDVYAQYDSGKIRKQYADEITNSCCKAFIEWYKSSNEGEQK